VGAAYARLVREKLAANANPANAVAMQAYMRDKFPFFGIKTPERRALVREVVAEHGLPPADRLEELARCLWDEPERECHYAAIGLLERMKKRLSPADLKWIEEIVVANAWWDSVDALSSPLIADLLKPDRAARDAWIDRWRISGDFWLSRVTLIFQRRYKTDTDEALLFALVRENAGSREFFIRKAIGWALREYTYIAPEAVASFVAATNLAPLSRREALKHLGAKSAGENDVDGE
jgi:3-methyladenine DNA glycosylase AlkD